MCATRVATTTVKSKRRRSRSQIADQHLTSWIFPPRSRHSVDIRSWHGSIGRDVLEERSGSHANRLRRQRLASVHQGEFGRVDDSCWRQTVSGSSDLIWDRPVLSHRSAIFWRKFGGEGRNEKTRPDSESRATTREDSCYVGRLISRFARHR